VTRLVVALATPLTTRAVENPQPPARAASTDPTWQSTPTAAPRANSPSVRPQALVAVVLTFAALAIAGCDRKGQGPNGNCGQTPGQCGYSK